MRLKIDGFMTKDMMYKIVDYIYETYNHEIDIITGVNVYFTPRKRDGAEMVLHNPEGLEVNILKVNVSDKRPVGENKKITPQRKPVKLIGIEGGRVA